MDLLRGTAGCVTAVVSNKWPNISQFSTFQVGTMWGLFLSLRNNHQCQIGAPHLTSIAFSLDTLHSVLHVGAQPRTDLSAALLDSKPQKGMFSPCAGFTAGEVFSNSSR